MFDLRKHLFSWFLFLLASVTLFQIRPAHAQWSPQASQFAYDTFKQFPAKEKLNVEQTSFLATMWGGVHRNLDYTFWRPESIDLPLGYFEKPLRVYLNIHKRRDEKTVKHGGRFDRIPRYTREKAPLIVFMPGVFADGDNPAARHFLNFFAQMGYHVLTLPNPWGEDYLRAHATSRLSSPELEGHVVLEATRKIIHDYIGEEWVSEVHVAGESLGAAIAAVAYGLDSQDKARPLFTGSANLFWPPMSLSHSINSLDYYIGAYRETFVKKCAGLSTKLMALYRAFTGGLLNDPTVDEEDCAGPLVLHAGFRKDLLENARQLDQMRGFGKSIELRGADLDAWELNMNFMGYIHEYAKQFGEYLDSKEQSTDSVYWMKLAMDNGHDKIRIFSSTDDFINFGADWHQSLGPKFEEGKSIILTPWGGHVGLTFQDNFTKFLRIQFEKQAQ